MKLQNERAPERHKKTDPDEHDEVLRQGAILVQAGEVTDVRRKWIGQGEPPSLS